jgi:branched-subunit amino acid aminotransferase/4-amino-4-deoxychorismate lyase
MKIDHCQHVALLIRNQIDISEGKFDEDDPAEEDEKIVTNSFRNIILGAKQKPLSFATIEALHSGDPAFEHFQEHFCSFLSILLPTETVGIFKSIFTQEAMVS